MRGTCRSCWQVLALGGAVGGGWYCLLHACNAAGTSSYAHAERPLLVDGFASADTSRWSQVAP